MEFQIGDVADFGEVTATRRHFGQLPLRVSPFQRVSFPAFQIFYETAGALTPRPLLSPTFLGVLSMKDQLSTGLGLGLFRHVSGTIRGRRFDRQRLARRGGRSCRVGPGRIVSAFYRRALLND